MPGSNTSFPALLAKVGSKSADTIKEDADVASQTNGAKTLADPVNGSFGTRGQKAGRNSISSTDGQEVIHCAQQPWMIELRGDAHRNGEIVVSYPRYVHPRDRDYRIQICEGLFRL